MRHIAFIENQSEYPVSILIKPSNLHRRDIEAYYINPLIGQGMKKSDFIAWDLKYDDKGKAPVKLIVEHIGNLLKAVKQVGSKYLLVADGAYFKKLTNEKKTESAYGYVKPCAIKGYEDLKIVLIPNFAGLFYNPAIQSKIDLGLNALVTAVNGMPATIGKNVLKDVTYIKHNDDNYISRVKDALNTLMDYPRLGVDIEGFSLEFHKAGIATIAFSWDKHSAIAIQVDYDLWPFESDDGLFGEQWDNVEVKALLKQFFSHYQGTCVYHNIGYDGKVLVYELFMNKDFFNYPGMMRGIETICRNFEDTKLVTYLATNSCAGNTLGLKQNTHEFTGDYAQDSEDIKDIRRIDLDPLLKYNAIDTCATLYLLDKYWDKMVSDGQLQVYEEIFKPSVNVIMQMELTGLPINMERVHEVDAELCGIRDKLRATLNANPIVDGLWYELRQRESDKAHAKWKKKTAPIEAFDYVEFNPGSDQQLQILLHEVMGYDVIDKTPTGAPSSGGDTLKKHLARAVHPDEVEVLESLIGLGEVSILIDTFINAFKNKSILKSDGWHYLHGNFNLGGTVSGRLSSSKPNLQNIPSGGKNPHSKLIKSCIQAPPGWLLIGADFASLEDRISALTTKDINKLRVYTDGYDGHCLRAFYYFGSQMPDIVETPDSINSIKKKYPDLRQESKAPTFLLTYGGTYHGMMKNLGWSESKSKTIEANYHKLYKESDDWVQGHIKNACQTGYVTVAFGMRVRTPVLKQVLYNDQMPYAAQSESRTAGNALGQSYGLLNNRAAVEFRNKTLRSKHVYTVLPVAHIHDAQYFMTPDNVDVVHWVNENLIPCMEWQELPEIQHDEVKLGGDLEIFHPNWASSVEIPNGASVNQIIKICKESVE